MGPHTHLTPPSSSYLIKLTGVWGITTEKVWNCKCHRRVSEAQPGQNFEGENLGQSRNLWREVPENWGQSPNREREGKRYGEGVQLATLKKICENLNFKPCRQSVAQFKQHSISFLAFIIFSLISLFSFSKREVIMVKPPKATIYRGAECRGVVLRCGFLKTCCKFQD